MSYFFIALAKSVSEETGYLVKEFTLKLNRIKELISRGSTAIILDGDDACDDKKSPEKAR